MVSMWSLFGTFLKVGTIGFGGPYALLSLIEREVVERRAWLSREGFAESIVAGSLTPGPPSFTASAFIGYRLRGFAGALAAAIAIVLPSFGLVMLLTYLYAASRGLTITDEITHTTGAAATGILLATVIRITRPVSRHRLDVAIAAVAFILLVKMNVHPVIILVAGGVAGGLFFRRHDAAGPEVPDREGAR